MNCGYNLIDSMRSFELCKKCRKIMLVGTLFLGSKIGLSFVGDQLQATEEVDL